MSDSVWSQVASGGKPVDTLSEYQKWQNLSQSQQQTALLQQEAEETKQRATGQGIKNQLDSLNLAPVEYGLTAAGIPNPGGAAGDVLSRGGYQPGGPGGRLQTNGMSTSGSTQGGGTAYPGQAAEQVLGIPMSPLDMATVFASPDRTKAITEILQKQGILKMQTIAGMPPSQFPQALDRLIQMGALSPSMAQQALSVPNGRERILAGLQDPNNYASLGLQASQAGMKANDGRGSPYVPDPTADQAAYLRAQAGSGGGARGTINENVTPSAAAATRNITTAGQVNHMVEVKVRNADGTISILSMPQDQLEEWYKSHPGSGPASPADRFDPKATLDLDTYVNRNTRYENGGNPNANQGNGVPGSSIRGIGQFSDSTWLDTIKNSNLPWARGMTDDQLLAVKNNPSAQSASRERDVQRAFTQQNAPKLEQQGVPVTTLSLGLAHHFGADGAAAIMSAPPGTPVSSLRTANGQPVASPLTLAQNRFPPNATTDQVIAQSVPGYGNNAVDINKTSQQPVNAIESGKQFGDTQMPSIETMTRTAAQDYKPVADAREGAAKAQSDQQTFMAAARYAGDAQVGANAGFRQAVTNFMNTYLSGDQKELWQKKLNDQTTTNFDLAKLLLQAKLGMETKYFGANGGIGTLNALGEGTPNPNMNKEGIKNLMERMAIASQRSIDYASGLDAYYGQQMRNLTPTDGSVPNYKQVGEYNKQFLDTHPPQMYELATQLLNGTAKPADWKKLTPVQQKQAADIAWRVDPTRNFTAPTGQTLLAPRNRQSAAAAPAAPAPAAPAPSGY